MIRAAIIIPLFQSRGGERKLSEIKQLNPRSHGKHGQAGLLFSRVQVLLEELQCLLTAGKCFDSQGLHPHNRKQEHCIYLKNLGQFCGECPTAHRAQKHLWVKNQSCEVSADQTWADGLFCLIAYVANGVHHQWKGRLH